MATRSHSTAAQNKDGNRGQLESKPTPLPVSLHGTSIKTVPAVKAVKLVAPSSPSPMPGAGAEEHPELLGSLTTQQQQRTSARVIKKLKLDDSAADRDKKESAECELTHHKLDEKVHPVKQRMPKALWSIDEKNLFFEALNEYGKDFDAITSYICAKMKKKGVTDSNLKTKHQVSHFYYRTWHKLSKHVHFNENVKKVAQELYALINYGELRKKLVSVNEKTCSRLGEMIASGSMAVRARGRNVRVRTPMCRALRTLNRMTERADYLRLCGRAQVTLRARRMSDWARVHAAAHNPRVAASLPLRTDLAAFIEALERRWDLRHSDKTDAKTERQAESCDMKLSEDPVRCGATEDIVNTNSGEIIKDESEDFNMEPERMIVLERLRPKKLALHVGPTPNANIHLPTISPGETLSSQKICFSSYLERMGTRSEKIRGNKIRTPKRQRKDSTTEKDKDQEQKKIKMEDIEMNKPIDIDETAIDGIELMANLTEGKMFDEEKPSTEDEKELKMDETDCHGDNKDIEIEKDVLDRDALDMEKYACEREKDMSEKEKDSFSEMEDETEKYNKSDTDNESDGKCEKQEKKQKYKNLKVKFRIRQRKRGGSVYTLVSDMQTNNITPTSQSDDCKTIVETEEKPQPDFDVDLVMRQIRKGWSVMDAGKLTIGDLYLMFGFQSKLELDYWWAVPTPPLPQPLVQNIPQTHHRHNSVSVDGIEKTTIPEKAVDKDKIVTKDKGTPEKGTDSSVEEDRDKARESDTDIFSPKNTFSQDSNDGLSGDERKCEQLASPEHKTHRGESCNASLRLINKLVNRPDEPTDTLMQERLTTMTSRLRRLLSMVGNVGSGATRCSCGHVCSQRRKPHNEKQTSSIRHLEPDPTLFRHPMPIAPKPGDNPELKPIGFEDLPRTARGRPRRDDSRVVVQRTLPLLPKLPVQNLIPVKIVPNTPAAPRKILPKPATVPTDNSYVYIISQPDGQITYEEDEGKAIVKLPFSPQTENLQEEIKDEDVESKPSIISMKKERHSDASEQSGSHEDTKVVCEQDNLTCLLPGESSMSLSPSRLLRDANGQWLDSEVQDFSLSSFLAHLDASGTKAHTELAVDRQLQSLMVDSSVDYVAKFADLAAEVVDDT